MTRITLDPDLRRRLLDLREPLELCDESGQVLARLLPEAERRPQPSEPQISPEEIQRRRQNRGKTYTTAEVLAHLESL